MAININNMFFSISVLNNYTTDFHLFDMIKLGKDFICLSQNYQYPNPINISWMSKSLVPL